MNTWVKFMNMRIEFMNTWVEFMNMRIEFMNTWVEFMNMRVEFMNMRVKFMNTRVKFMNNSAYTLHIAAPCTTSRTARSFSGSAAISAQWRACSAGHVQRTWPMHDRGPPRTGEHIPAPCGAFPRTFL
jgi:hypothetical protein